MTAHLVCWWRGHVWSRVTSLSHPHLDARKCQRCGRYESKEPFWS